jgi:protein SCO1/2
MMCFSLTEQVLFDIWLRWRIEAVSNMGIVLIGTPIRRVLLMNKRFLLWVMLPIAVGVGILAGWWWVQSRPKLSKTLITPPIEIADFRLSAFPDRQVRLSDYRGKWVMVYFGYTYCPDVCPSTLNDLKKAWQLLADAQKFQLLMITADPERDSPEVLATYLAHFHPSFLGLSGSLTDTHQIAKNFGAFFEKHTAQTQGGYLVDHSSSVFVLDPAGQLVYIISFGTPPAIIAQDLTILARQTH